MIAVKKLAKRLKAESQKTFGAFTPARSDRGQLWDVFLISPEGVWELVRPMLPDHEARAYLRGFNLNRASDWRAVRKKSTYGHQLIPVVIMGKSAWSPKARTDLPPDFEVEYFETAIEAQAFTQRLNELQLEYADGIWAVQISTTPPDAAPSGKAKKPKLKKPSRSTTRSSGVGRRRPAKRSKAK